jgi:hypothetical protein
MPDESTHPAVFSWSTSLRNLPSDSAHHLQRSTEPARVAALDRKGADATLTAGPSSTKDGMVESGPALQLKKGANIGTLECKGT